jgi:hypothetical protein
MFTCTTARPRPQARQSKPKNRKLRLAQHPDTHNGLGILDITEDGKLTCFWLKRIPHEFGEKAFRLEKFEVHQRGDGDDAYDVLLDREGSTCCCKGFLRWGTECRHIGALKALCDAGRL